MTKTEQLAGNVTFTLIARGAMVVTPVLVAFIGVLLGNIYSGLAGTVDKLAETTATLTTRVAVLENGNRDIRDLRMSINTLSQNVAALTATVQALQAQRRSSLDGNPTP